MNIKRVIVAIQRTSHLRNRDLRKKYEELFYVLWIDRLHDLEMKTKLNTLSVIAEVKGIACAIKNLPSQDEEV